jgi:hypothetical protein
MKNPATHTYRNQLNSFTNLIAANQRFGAKTKILLRNGTIVEPIYKPAEDETCEDAFFTEDYEYCWNLDGTSVTRSHYDMMEIV